MHGSNFLRRTAGRLGFVLVLGLILVTTVSAYTVVMSGGRRVEVPSQFVLTAATLTYEVSPGVQVTLLTAAIDIAATEKANNEASGAFMKRVQSALPELPATQQLPVSPRPTLTNRDLESSVRRRRDSELAYEDRRKQLGLPSVEESRRQAAAEADSIRVELQQQQAVAQESESYWRERAGALRTEIAAVDAQLAYVRSRLEERPWGNDWSGGWSNLFFSTGGVSFGSFGGGGSFGRAGGFRRGPFGNPGGFHGGRHRPGTFVAPNSGARVRAGVTFGGGAIRGRVFANPGTGRPARGHFPGGFGAGNVVVSGWGFPIDYSYERSELITRFNELGATRAGLNARWRELEDEARRAGVSPGWLRP